MKVMNMRSRQFWLPMDRFFDEVVNEDPERVRWTAEYQLGVLMEVSRQQWDSLPHTGPAAQLFALSDFGPELSQLSNFLNHPVRHEVDSPQGMVSRLRAIAKSVADKHEDLAVELAMNAKLPF